MHKYITMALALMCGVTAYTALAANSYVSVFDLDLEFGSYLDAGRPPKTLAEWRRRAQSGDTAAQVYLGMAYQYGAGVPTDSAEAERLYRAAALNGYAFGQVLLGGILSNGVRPHDFQEAFRWFLLAAEQGDAAGQEAIGDAYRYGRGVPKNSSEAVRWYRMAAKQGLASAQWKVGGAYRLGAGVKRDYGLAYMWFTLASSHSHSIDPVIFNFAPADRAEVAQLMTPAEKAHAQQLSKACLASMYRRC